MNFRLCCMLALLTVTSATEACAAEVDRPLSGKVLEISETPRATSGVIKTWVEIRLDSSTRDPSIPLLLLYLSAQQRSPLVGQYCTFRTHLELVNGIVGRSMQQAKRSEVIDDFECSAERQGNRASRP